MSINNRNVKLLTATAAAALMAFSTNAYAADHVANVGDTTSWNGSMQDHRGGGRDSDSHGDSGSHDDSDHQDADHGSSGRQDGAQGNRGNRTSDTSTRGNRSMEDILRDISGDEDSDRPDYAGGRGGPNDHGGQPSGAGSARGDLYGDMYVILRDDNGVPILNAAGFVQPIDAAGNLIPLDEEGVPIDPSLAQEAELGRLNVGRSPRSVLDHRADEIVTMLNSATDISLDAAGRLVLTVDGVTKTIDSPLENLAIYVALMTQGTIPGVTDLPGTAFDHLIDGVFTIEDVASAASFLAAASDKASTLTADDIAYMNAILGINTTRVGDVTYSDMDYSSFSYDRSDVYGSVTATVLVQQPDGSWVPTTVNVYDAVFGGEDYSGTGTFSAFAQSADDARAIINFIHEYALPADSL